MIRVHTLKIYPSEAQSLRLDQWLWASRRLWNAFLEHRIKAYKRRGEAVSYASQSARIKLWRENDPRMLDCPFTALRGSAQRLDKAFKDFFRRCKTGDKPGFPRFKSRVRMRSLEFNQPDTYIRSGKVRIPKLGLIRCRGTMPAATDIRCMRIIRKASGWYASITVEDGVMAPGAKTVVTSIGVDVGLTAFATMSDGSKIKNPRYYRKAQNRLARVQRRLSRKTKGSHNRRKYAQRVARLHERVADCRKNFLHHESKKLVNEYDLIAVENLNIQGMMRSTMSKSVNDAGWGQFSNYLSYKALSAGKTLVKVNPRDTTQLCSACGARVPKDLSIRVHSCSCGFVACRDHNAAINILNHGLRAVGPNVTPVKDFAAVVDDRLSTSSISVEAGRVDFKSSPLPYRSRLGFPADRPLSSSIYALPHSETMSHAANP